MKATASESNLSVRLLAAAAAVVAPLALLPAAPLAGAAAGVASAHLWFLNQPGREPRPLTLCPVSIAIAASGFTWLMAGIMMLARIG